MPICRRRREPCCAQRSARVKWPGRQIPHWWPLIESLDFIRNKKSWRFVFRRGLFEIGEDDFQKIARYGRRFV